MRKIKVFFRTFVKSLTDLSYYRDILKAKFSFSLKYLLFLLFLVSLVNGILFASQLSFLLPEIDPFVKKVESAARDLYPSDLKFTIKDSKIGVNVKEPYFIPFPDEFGKPDNYDNLLVVNTRGAVEDYQKHKAVIMVTDDSLVYPEDSTKGGAYQVTPLNDLIKDVPDNTVITREDYAEVLSAALPFLSYVKPGVYILLILSVLVAPFVGAFVGLLGKLLYLLVFTLPIWVFAKILGKQVGYSGVYRLGMHGVTWGIILAFALSIFSVVLNFWLYTLVFLVFMSLVIVKLQKA